jgi:hypothetical protein
VRLPRVVRHMSPAAFGAENVCTGEGQQQFTRLALTAPAWSHKRLPRSVVRCYRHFDLRILRFLWNREASRCEVGNRELYVTSVFIFSRSRSHNTWSVDCLQGVCNASQSDCVCWRQTNVKVSHLLLSKRPYLTELQLNKTVSPSLHVKCSSWWFSRVGIHSLWFILS